MLAAAAALAAIAFVGAGGSELGRATGIEIAMTLAGGAALVVAVLRSRGDRLDGALTLAAFGALAALTAVSIAWSIVPDLSWQEADRTLSYLAIFAAALACGRLVPHAYTTLLRAILLAATAVCVYALASRVWPAAISPDEIYARIEQPYAYWNALGATAALAVPAALWLGTRRTGYRPANALAFPVLTLLVVTLFLSYSRGALILAAAAALIWLAVVPLRLRSLMLLAVSLAGAAPVVAWALSKDAFTKNYVPLAVRESVSTRFGLFLLATVIVVLAAGLAVGFRFGRRPPRRRVRLVAGLAAAAVAIAVPIALVAILAASDRGITGTIAADYESLTNASGKTPGGPGRLLTASSSRGLYWHQAKQVFLANELHGSGAGTFGVARLRYRRDPAVARHAHGFVSQTLSDLGILGLIAIAALLVAWLVVAGRAVALTVRPRRRLPFGADRVALVALALSALVYGLHSAIDWIWFVPGPTAMALVAAGFLAGRGPLRQRLDGAVAPVQAEVPEASAAEAAPPGHALSGVAAGDQAERMLAGVAAAPVSMASPDFDAPTEVVPPAPPPQAPPPQAPWWRTIVNSRQPKRAMLALGLYARPILAAAVAVVTLTCAWAVWQPLRSDETSNDALRLSARHDFPAALRAAARAHRYDPLTPRPQIVRASIENAQGNRPAALHDLELAVRRYRLDPQVWLQLAEYRLDTLGDAAGALQTVRGALYLDSQSREGQTVFFAARARLSPGEVVPPGTATPTTPAPGSTGND